MSIQSTEGSLPASGSGVTYTTVDVTYFKARGLKRYAGVASLWALGVVYFALKGRHKLVLSLEEEFALSKRTTEYKSH